MKKFSTVLMTTVLALALAACGSAPATNSSNGGSAGGTEAQAPAKTDEVLTIKHQLGEAKVKKNPQKVVVFDFGALDTLEKLGIPVIGVPQANIPPYLEKYKDTKYKNVGSLVEPDFEKINAAAPDLILISGRQQTAYEELSKIAPTVFVGVDNTKYMESFESNMKTIGQIFGKETEIEKEVATVGESVKKLNAKASSGDKKALIVLVNGGKISAYGPGSRFGILHETFGFAPVDSSIQVTTHGQSISPEFIAQKNPDLLFVIDRDAAVAGGGDSPAKKVIENELVKNTNAFKNGGIVYLDPNYWYLSGGGLISVSKMVEEVDKGVK
ncbi:siderophore ABC transporter substrate-binding protein [Paenibacillus puerhi]|uniref:siderophore ABC transporter substrate-binding protein n=1 Tax=Paenibacillus puerhi TaxID=2692622 RepID=UPI00191670A1|nr:siderophore ABC transporter substrate-binding protein [Paenibacillus puerhi]